MTVFDSVLHDSIRFLSDEFHDKRWSKMKAKDEILNYEPNGSGADTHVCATG